MEWISVENKLPEEGEYVLTTCPGMGPKGESKVIVAEFTFFREWYSGFPYDQPIKPTHWMYFPKPFKQ